jgi:hypothetical protein
MGPAAPLPTLLTPSAMPLLPAAPAPARQPPKAPSPRRPVEGGGLLKRSAGAIFEACDSMLSFVENRALRALTPAGDPAKGGNPQLMVRPVRADDGADGPVDGSGTRSRQQYDLVGFMDVDPFERSRKYFKRKNTRMLL